MIAPRELHSSGGRPTARHDIARICAGNAMEWYDWAIYATFSVFFAGQFFNGESGTSSLLKTLAIFAIGFVVRPFGAAFLGRLADRRGRKPAMLLSCALAAGGSMLIGLTPTAHTVGILAPTILLLARVAQGLGHGGEIPSAQTYLAEAAPRRHRGLWTSAIYVSGTIGVLFGTVLGATLSGLLTHEEMTAYGWRVPFIIGGLFGIYTFIMRIRVPETSVFHIQGDSAAPTSARSARPRPGVFRRILAHPRPALQVFFMSAGFTVNYYLWTGSAAIYAIHTKHTDAAKALWVASAAQVVLILALPAWGSVSDRIGRKPVMIGVGLAVCVLTIPILNLIQGQAWQLFIALAVMSLLVAGRQSIVPAVNAELFPTGIRASGMGIPDAIATALFGGTAPYLQTYLAESGKAYLFNYFVIVMVLIATATVFTLPETKGLDLTTTRDTPRPTANAAAPDSD